MTAADGDRPDRASDNPIWNAGPDVGPGSGPDVFDRMMNKVRLHLKTHRQAKMLYWIDGRFWIRCYTHKRLEPATWLV